MEAMRNMYTVLAGNPEERDHFRDLGAGEKITLRFI
jgi:hypothetical protein